MGGIHTDSMRLRGMHGGRAEFHRGGERWRGGGSGWRKYSIELYWAAVSSRV